MTTPDVILAALVVAGFSATYWSLAKIALALSQVGQSVERVAEMSERAERTSERIEQSVERIAQYLAVGPRRS